MMNKPYSNSAELFEAAKAHMPGGVNSPVRAFNAVGGTPVFFERAKGAELISVDGRAYLDFVGSWGPAILGHGHEGVLAAVHEAVDDGLSFGAPTARETALAKMIKSRLPSVEKVRLTSSGTEATMSAIRLARAYTNRARILKFEGCYHGHSDSLLVKAGSGLLTFDDDTADGGNHAQKNGAKKSVPSSKGVPADLAALTLTLPYNDTAAVTELFARAGDTIAGVIVEPIAGNMNCIIPDKGFMTVLRELTEKHGAVLMFDEVMTGFRVDYASAQGYFGITPDMTCLGKVIGGGLPLAAFGGRADIMDMLAPLGPVYQAGTLSGNPIAVAAGTATLAQLDKPAYEHLNSLTTHLTAELADYPVAIAAAGGMFGLFLGTDTPPKSLDAVGQGVAAYNQLFHALLAEGMYIAPSAYEAAFISLAHTTEDMTRLAEGIKQFLNAQ